MSVNGVTSAGTNTAAAAAAAAKTTAGTKAAEQTAAAVTEQQDSYEAGEKTQAQTTYKPDMETIRRLKSETTSKVNAFHQMVEKLFTNQAGKANDFLSMLAGQKGEKNEDIMIAIDPETRAAAQAEIGEDGYWGVKQTSQRILDFAKALSGGDPSKLDVLERAFEKGYGAAANVFGGNLPDISKQTYDAVKKGFADMREAAGVEA